MLDTRRGLILAWFNIDVWCELWFDLWVGCLGLQGSMPVMDLPTAEAPMTGRQKRKAWMQAKEVQGGENSKEEEVGTEDGLGPAAGLAKRREAKPNPKYLGPEWVR